MIEIEWEEGMFKPKKRRGVVVGSHGSGVFEETSFIVFRTDREQFDFQDFVTVPVHDCKLVRFVDSIPVKEKSTPEAVPSYARLCPHQVMTVDCSECRESGREGSSGGAGKTNG